MNSLVVFVAALAIANAGVLHYESPILGSSALLKGPSARSTIVGADGVGISTHFEGGVVAPTHEVSVAVPEVVPVIARHEPLIHHVEPYIARAEPIYAPSYPVSHVLEHGRADIIAGPSGTIVANKDYDVSSIVPIEREFYVQPAVRSYLPVHGLNYGYDRSIYRHGLVGLSNHYLKSNLW